MLKRRNDMPCWTVTTVEISLRAANLDVLQKALENELGVKVRRSGETLTFSHSSQRSSVRIANGRVEVERGNEGLAAQINVAYSRQVVRDMATRFRWQAKETKQNAFEVVRRF
jgi:hypothetical protein